MAALIPYVREYRALDDALKKLNTQVSELRDKRKTVELNMAVVLKSAQFATIHKLDISTDGSVIKIQRPDMHSKPWSLSVKDLKYYLDEFAAKGIPFTAEACHEYIVNARKLDLVSEDFTFTRIVSKPDNDGDI